MTPRVKAMLVGLAAVAAVAVMWMQLSSSGGSAGPGPVARAGGRRVAGRTAGGATQVVDLRVDALTQKPATHEIGRDPFDYGPEPPPPPPPPPSAEELAAQRAAEIAAAEAQKRAAEEAERQRQWKLAHPDPPPIDVTYLGSFGSASRRVAVFSNGKEIVNAREGDTVNGKFIVHKIGFESVDLRFVGFPDTPPQRLAIGGPRG